METASSWGDMEETFFTCSICLDLFKDPKQLPCLHRYCKGCLKPVVDKNKPKRDFACPLCQVICNIPDDGVDGFVTDFHSRNIIEYIRLQKSVKSEEVRKCTGCSEEGKTTAYRSRCKGFLCDQCYKFHETSDMTKDHETHTLALADIEGKKLSLEKLASLTVAPRCHEHDDKPAQIFCGSCGNIPICMVCCIGGRHKTHELHDVEDFTCKERERATKILATLDTYEGNVTSTPARIEKAKKMLESDAMVKTDKLRSDYHEGEAKLQRQLREADAEIKREDAEINRRVKLEVDKLEKQRQMGVWKPDQTFDKLVTELKQRKEGIRGKNWAMHAKREEKINEMRKSLYGEYRDLEASIEQQQRQKYEQLEVISGRFLQRKERFDNYKSLVSSILGSNDDWVTVRSLYDVNRAINPLIEEIREEFEEIYSLSGIAIERLSEAK